MKPLPSLPETRRNFIAQSISALSAIGMIGCEAPKHSETPNFAGYIDAHSHVWTPDTQRFPLGAWMKPAEMEPPSFTAEELLAVAKPSGVDRVVLIQHAPYYGDDNSYLIDCAKRHTGRFSIVAIVEERRSDLSSHLQLLKQQGVRGIRIGPTRYADRSLVKEPQLWLKAVEMRKLWQLAMELELILCPLISSEYLPTLEPILAEFPTTNIVIDHFGHVDATKPAEMESLRKLAKYEHLHVKASGFYKFGDKQAPYEDLSLLMKQVTDAFGVERVLWGSDCPYQLQNGNNYHDAVALIAKGLEFLDTTARMAILRENAARLFFR